LLDAGQPLGSEQLTELLAFAERGHFRPLEAQVRRGLGMVERDRDMLTRSLDLWEAMGAVPYAARVRCERALLTGDQAELEKGLAALERLGDRLQLGRYERRQGGWRGAASRHDRRARRRAGDRPQRRAHHARYLGRLGERLPGSEDPRCGNGRAPWLWPVGD